MIVLHITYYAVRHFRIVADDTVYTYVGDSIYVGGDGSDGDDS